MNEPTNVSVPLRVLIVDDHAGFRRAAAAMLSADPAFAVAESVASGEEALSVLASSPIDIALVDVHMSPVDGIDVANRHAAAGNSAAIILMSTSSIVELADGARASAVAGFIPKEALSAADVMRVWSSWKATRPRRGDAAMLSRSDDDDSCN